MRVAGPGLGQHRGSYQVAGVGGAGALLGDTHAEAGQAALGVAGTQVEVVGPAVAAGEALHLGLGRQMGGWVGVGSSRGSLAPPAAFEASLPSRFWQFWGGPVAPRPRPQLLSHAA